MVILEIVKCFSKFHYDAYAVTYEKCKKANSVMGKPK